MSDFENCDKAAGHDVTACCSSCHELWDFEGEPMADGYDKEGYDLHVCCTAALASRNWVEEHKVMLKLRSRNEKRD